MMTVGGDFWWSKDCVVIFQCSALVLWYWRLHDRRICFIYGSDILISGPTSASLKLSFRSFQKTLLFYAVFLLSRWRQYHYEGIYFDRYCLGVTPKHLSNSTPMEGPKYPHRAAPHLKLFISTDAWTAMTCMPMCFLMKWDCRKFCFIYIPDLHSQWRPYILIWYAWQDIKWLITISKSHAMK